MVENYNDNDEDMETNVGAVKGGFLSCFFVWRDYCLGTLQCVSDHPN